MLKLNCYNDVLNSLKEKYTDRFLENYYFNLKENNCDGYLCVAVADGPTLGVFDVFVIDYDALDNIYLVQYFWQGVGDKEKTKEYAFVYLSDGKVDNIKTTWD